MVRDWTRKYLAAAGLCLAACLCLSCFPALADDPTPTATPNVPPLSLTVTGSVTSGTAGITISPGLPLLLHVAHPDAAAVTDVARHQAILGADLTFRFENIRALPDDLIFVSASYGGVQQSSSILRLSADQQAINLPLVLYAPTNDPGVLSLVRAQYIIDIKSGGLLQVLASEYYRNSGDHFFITSELTTGGQAVSVKIPLPIGAVGIAFDTPQRFAIGGNTVAPVVQDTRPVQPGQLHEIVFSYQLPYEGGAAIDQDYPYNTESVEVLIPDDAKIGLAADSSVVSNGTSRAASYENSANTVINPQRPYTQYTFKAPMKAGDRLIYTLEGGASGTPVGGQSSSRSTVSVGVGAFLVLVLLLLGGIVVATFGLRQFLVLRRRRRT